MLRSTKHIFPPHMLCYVYDNDVVDMVEMEKQGIILKSYPQRPLQLALNWIYVHLKGLKRKNYYAYNYGYTYITPHNISLSI